jgi:hypothetical protein
MVPKADALGDYLRAATGRLAMSVGTLKLIACCQQRYFSR